MAVDMGGLKEKSKLREQIPLASSQALVSSGKKHTLIVLLSTGAVTNTNESSKYGKH